VGGFFGLALMVVGRAGRKSAIPFGPWMLLGALLGILWGGALADLYLDSLSG
jgi:leader peptidase (prepilin peptidase)/N-methyltransferase